MLFVGYEYVGKESVQKEQICRKLGPIELPKPVLCVQPAFNTNLVREGHTWATTRRLSLFLMIFLRCHCGLDRISENPSRDDWKFSWE
jgi:hypothetical protein